MHLFFTDFLLSIHFDMNREDADIKAKQMSASGATLYEKTEEEFKECLGQDGVSIYRVLYKSNYGYVRISSLHNYPYSPC